MHSDNPMYIYIKIDIIIYIGLYMHDIYNYIYIIQYIYIYKIFVNKLVRCA